MKVNVTQHPPETYDYSPKWKRVLAMKPFAYLRVQLTQSGIYVVGLQKTQPTIAQVNSDHPDWKRDLLFVPFVGDVFLFMDGAYADSDPEELPNTSFPTLEMNIRVLAGSFFNTKGAFRTLVPQDQWRAPNYYRDLAGRDLV